MQRSLLIGDSTVRAVVLKGASKFRFHAYLWWKQKRFAHAFARREAAERWLDAMVRRYFGDAA